MMMIFHLKSKLLPFLANWLTVKKKNLKNTFILIFWLKHPFRCCFFSYCEFLLVFVSLMPNKAFFFHFLQMFANFWLIWHEIKQSTKTRRNGKTQHLDRCFNYLGLQHRQLQDGLTAQWVFEDYGCISNKLLLSWVSPKAFPIGNSASSIGDTICPILLTQK